jgi:salicylate hydroxylase
MSSPPIIIAGGGIAGLASALALRDYDAVVFEQSEKFSPIGAGLQLGPNAVRALQKLGAWDAVAPIASSPPEIHLRDGLTGRLLKRLTLGAAFERRFGAPYRAAHRADLHAALFETVKLNRNVEIKLDVKIVTVEIHAADVSIQTSNRRYATPALLATDGVQSAIRQAVFTNSAAVSSGEIHHRSLIAMPSIPGIEMECVNVWMYPRSHVVHYPVGKTPRLNLVAITPEHSNPQDLYREACEPLKMLLALAQNSFTPWPSYFVPHLNNWSKGSVLLLGDAAHGTLPYLAQGAAMALEDAACLATVLPTTNSMRHAFAEVVQRRMARTKRLHKDTVAAGNAYHMRGLARIARNVGMSAIPQSLLLSRLNWLYSG